MKKCLPLLVLPVLLAIGCNKKDKDDLKDYASYYQTYEVSYNKTSKETQAFANYKLGTASGDQVQLSSNANVRANNTSSNTTTIELTRYYWNFTGMPDVGFLLTKANGSTIANNVGLAEVGDINITTTYPEFVPKAGGIGFKWDGAPIQGGEKLTASIISGANLVNVSKDFTGDSVYFSRGELSEVSAEWITVQLTRTKELPLDRKDGEAGGMIKLSLVTFKYTTLQ